jgi:hypothetical protein
MYDPRNNLANQVSQQLLQHFGDKVYKTIIPRNVRLAEAPSHGLPALLYDKSSAGAMAYLVKPFSISDLIPAIEVALSRFAEITELEREVADLGERLETRKLVERAKGLLQARHAMTEPEAFNWMQRAAMDRRTSMKRVAEVVLESFDGPSRDPSAR